MYIIFFSLYLLFFPCTSQAMLLKHNKANIHQKKGRKVWWSIWDYKFAPTGWFPLKILPSIRGIAALCKVILNWNVVAQLRIITNFHRWLDVPYCLSTKSEQYLWAPFSCVYGTRMWQWGWNNGNTKESQKLTEPLISGFFCCLSFSLKTAEFNLLEFRVFSLPCRFYFYRLLLTPLWVGNWRHSR